MYGYVYKTTNLINGKIYIGQHKEGKFNSFYLGSGIKIKHAIKKYGKENFTVEIVEECEDLQSLNEKEKYWIEFYNARDGSIGYNISAGGEQEYLDSKGSNNPHFGVHTNYGGGMKGKHHSERTKKLLSSKSKGIPQDKAFAYRRTRHLCKRVQNLETGVVYASYKEANNAYNKDGKRQCSVGRVVDTYRTTFGCHYISIKTEDDILNSTEREKLIRILNEKKRKAFEDGHMKSSNSQKGGHLSKKAIDKLKRTKKIKREESINRILIENNIDLTEYIELHNKMLNKCPNKFLSSYYHISYNIVRKLNEYFNLQHGSSNSHG